MMETDTYSYEMQVATTPIYNNNTQLTNAMIPPDKVEKMINPPLATNCDQIQSMKSSFPGRIFSFNSTPNAVATNQFFISDSHLNSIAPVAIIPIAIIHAHKSNRELCLFSNVNYWMPLYLFPRPLPRPPSPLSAINWITHEWLAQRMMPWGLSTKSWPCSDWIVPLVVITLSATRVHKTPILLVCREPLLSLFRD